MRSESQHFTAGDKVEWNGPGRIRGVVKRKLKAPLDIKGYLVAASNAKPQYLVESDETGEQAALKPSALRRIGD